MMSWRQYASNSLTVPSEKQIFSYLNSIGVEKSDVAQWSGGVKDIFIKGLADAVRQISYVNMTIDQAVDVLMTKVIDNEYTKRYIRATAMDIVTGKQIGRAHV